MTLSNYLKNSNNVNTKHNKKIKIAILSSFTINGLAETIKTKCSEIGINCITYVGPYNQYKQEILDENSGLQKFEPDITFLVLDTRHILGNLFFDPYSLSTEDRKDFVKNTLFELEQLIENFKKRNNSKLIISNFSIPTYSPFGICESKTEISLSDIIEDINKELKNKIKNESEIFLYNFNNFIAKYGEEQIFDYRQYFYGDIKVSLKFIPKLADEFLGFVKAVLGISKKCIVLDLDNTLWGGIVGEDGFSGIKIGTSGIGKTFSEFQRLLLALSKRGIILAINSKNNYEDALEVIQNHPDMILREKDFACMKINWNDKVINMKEIAEELNIGLQSIVFIDDEPRNRALMKKAIPEIFTLDFPNDSSLYSQSIMNINDFNVLKITNEDRTRGSMYIQQRKRNELSKKSSNLEDFLKELETQVTIKPANEFTIPRISQLTLKTNQFNLTTTRYQEEDIKNLNLEKHTRIGCAEIKDKFGNNGITGVYIIKEENPSEWNIDTFLLSCRVMGREVENAIMNHIIIEAKNNDIKSIKAKFIPSKKNMPAESFLPNYGFKYKSGYWIYDVNENIKNIEHIKIEKEK